MWLEKVEPPGKFEQIFHYGDEMIIMRVTEDGEVQFAHGDVPKTWANFNELYSPV